MMFGLVASTLWMVNSIYSIGYMRGHDEPRQTSFFVCFAIAISSTIGLAFSKNLFTLFIFGIYRLGAAVPSPGVDVNSLRDFADSADQNGFLGIINLFSGGALETMSVFALGIMPYITASIIMQLLAVVIPRLQSLQEEGESGRKVITQWTRYMTVALALLQSTGFTFLFASGQFVGDAGALIPSGDLQRTLTVILSMTAGTALIMWLGELITERGIGNGMSLIIFLSIVSQLPSQIGLLWANSSALQFWVTTGVMVALTVGIEIETAADAQPQATAQK